MSSPFFDVHCASSLERFFTLNIWRIKIQKEVKIEKTQSLIRLWFQWLCFKVDLKIEIDRPSVRGVSISLLDSQN